MSKYRHELRGGDGPAPRVRRTMLLLGLAVVGLTAAPYLLQLWDRTSVQVVVQQVQTEATAAVRDLQRAARSLAPDGRSTPVAATRTSVSANARAARPPPPARREGPRPQRAAGAAEPAPRPVEGSGLRVIAIVTGAEEREALVRAPDGRVLLVRPGSTVGPDGARVLGVGPEGVVLEGHDHSGPSRLELRIAR